MIFIYFFGICIPKIGKKVCPYQVTNVAIPHAKECKHGATDNMHL